MSIIDLKMNSYDLDSVNFNVGTLNFSASIISPYEFHSGVHSDAELFEFRLNEAFKKLALQVYPNFED